LGVRLDWRIEAEQVQRRSGEDPRSRRQRWRKLSRLVLLILVVVGIVSGVTLAVAARLSSVDAALRQHLIDAAQAEVTALRLGDFEAFMGLQRSASEAWITGQRDRFNRYQDLKTSAGLDLTGETASAAIDGQRGRVVLVERLEGIAYHTVWFYWRYNDGWRHVPSDYTFWGVENTLAGQAADVRYHELDTALAEMLQPRVDRWWADGCRLLACSGEGDDTPRLLVDVVATPDQMVRWDQDVDLTLTVPSPLAGDERAPADEVLPNALEDDVARALAERLFDQAMVAPLPDSEVTANADDAAWLRSSAIEWLTASFTGRSELRNLAFTQSLIDRFGAPALAQLARALGQNPTLGAMVDALGGPLETLNVDWRPFFQWRLDLEKTLLSRNDTGALAALWDMNDPTAQAALQNRMQAPLQATAQVQQASLSYGPDGLPQAAVGVTVDGAPAIVYFRLIDGTWKRFA
jgi:hypothetical protein